MSKFKDKVTQLALEVGGSHYPNVNPDLHDQMVKAVVRECVLALSSTDRSHVYTTFDQAQFEGTLAKAELAIKERFGL